LASTSRVTLVGNGMLAQAFARAIETSPPLLADTRILAFGVSNSTCDRSADFARDEARVLDELKASGPCRIVYLSTTSVEDQGLRDSMYVRHKLRMERTVLEAGNATVFRLGQIIGFPINHSNLVNVLYDRICKGLETHCWRGAERRIMASAHAAAIAMEILRRDEGKGTGSRIVNLSVPHAIAVSDLIAVIADVLGRRALVRTVDHGCVSKVVVDDSECAAVARDMGIEFDVDYCRTVVAGFVKERMSQVFAAGSQPLATHS
jgi:nucleoside-diphosphate-sugar epimerase